MTARLFSKFLADESGATAVEYGVIAGLIALALVTTMTLAGDAVGNTFQYVADRIIAAVDT